MTIRFSMKSIDNTLSYRDKPGEVGCCSLFISTQKSTSNSFQNYTF